MSKAGKRGKSGDVKGGPAVGGKWDQVLSSCAFEEENWNPCVTWVVGHQSEDSKHIEALNVIVQTGLRKLFSVVTKDQLFLDVKELGNPKAKKSKEIPANAEVCEACKPHVDAGEPIPVPLLAKLIKWKLMAIKTADIKRRDAETKALAEKKKAKEQDKGGKERAKSPKKGGKKTPEPQQAKEGSKLKKRGDDDSDNKFIDDEPDDGPQHYIIISGFHDPRVFQYLEEIGVNINSVIGVSSQDYTPLKAKQAPDTENKDNALVEQSEEEIKEAELKEELNTFWKDLLPLLQRLPDSSRLHDIARLEYEVKSLMIPVDPNDAEQKTQYSTALFEDIAVMIYDLLDAKRLYKTYLENLKLVNVPVYGQEEVVDASPVPPPTPGATKGDVQSGAPQDLGATSTSAAEKTPPPPVDMRYYNDLMNTVPYESISIPLVMHVMLEQIVATEEGKEPPSEQAPPTRSDGLNFNLASYLTSLAFKLGLSEEEHQALSEVVDLPPSLPELPSPPELINIQDDISNRTQHLKSNYGFDPAKVERNMLSFLPFAHLCQLQRPSSAEARQRAARLQELIHYCTGDGVSKSELDRSFKQFVFESVDLATTDPNGFILDKEQEGLHQSAIPWDDPYPYYKIMIPVPEKVPGIDLPAMSTPSDERSGACSPDVGEGHGEGRSSTDGSVDSQKKGILIATHQPSVSGIISPRRSRSNSVHWDACVGGDDMEVNEEGKPDPKIFQEALMEVVDAQKRNLDQWCFAEHFTPPILMQVLQEASYSLPFLETYHHKRDETLMLILHNPFSQELHNIVDWHKELHSNVGFRNYLEYTAESIVDWLKEKEAEYQARMLSAEVESMQKEEEEKAKAAEKADKKAKSPRKSPSRSKSPKGSRASSQERVSSASSNPYIRQGSLKAWQAEQDKIAAEEEEKEKAKLEKRTRSAEKLREKEEKEKAEKARSPRGSAKSRQSKSEVDSTAIQQTETAATEEPKEEEKYWPFSGYNTGNQLVHVSGITTTLFPSDGGQIKTHRTEFAQGTTTVQSTVIKDSHIFSVHILNPREDMGLPEDYQADLKAMEGSNINCRSELSTADKSETEKSEKEESKGEDSSEKDKSDDVEINTERPAVSQFGSITAQLSDGMVLSLSQFGPSGESYLKPYEPTLYLPPLVTESPSLPQAAASPTKSKKDVGKKGQPTPEPEKLPGDEEIVEEEKKDLEKPLPKQSFQELFVTCPDGLSVKYFLQSSIGVTPSSPENRQLAVKQSYPFKTKGAQECESARRKYIQTEVSRVITADGTVVKNMVDGSVEVLSADGTVSVFTGQWTFPSSRSSSPTRSVKSPGPDANRPETPSKKGRGSASKIKKGNAGDADQEEEVKLTPTDGNWVITYPNGERLQILKDNGDCTELASVPICIATDPDTQQTMATRDDHVITVSYPDGTTVVEHADGTRITVYYRETSMAGEENEGESSPEVISQTLKFVKVECPAFATVEFNATTSENLTVFGSGTSINVFPDGYYILHHSRGGRVEVDTEGTLVYFPRRSRFLEHLMPERELQYVLRHNAEVIVETVDPEGNVFNVRSTGDYHVIPVQGEEALSDDSDEQNPKRDSKILSYGQHAPRFFIIHADGSGTELLRYQDIAEYLMMAEQNPATAVLKDHLPEHPGVTGITILKPYITSLSEKWFKGYDQESIVPQGIRCRDLKTLPPKEYKKMGPKFGTNVGQGLSVGAATKGPIRIPILKCPNKLELRQIIQYRPVSDELRERLRNGLQEYAKAVVSRMQSDDFMTIDDPRTEDEKILAEDLKSLAESQKPKVREFEQEQIKSLYETSVAPPPPSPPATPQPKRTQADWERDRRELEEEAEAKKKLKNKMIGPYFDSELGKAFLLTQASDMDEMMRQLASDPRTDGCEAIRGETNSRLTYTQSPALTQQVPSHQGMSVLSDRSTNSESPATNNNIKNGQDTPLSYAGMVSEAATVTPSGGVRPHNPTPAHATGQGSPSPLRPKNPTPAHAGKVQTDRPGNPTPKIALGVETPSEYEPSIARGEYPMILEHPWEEEDTEMKSTDRELSQLKALTTNVLGEPRSEPVPFPTSIKGGRPGAQPNFKFKTVEDPVRRQVRTSLIAGASPKGLQQLNGMRGLICQPEGVNFGVLKEGCTYAYTVSLRNTGVDTCRFKVRQPPPATGLRIIYKPGPVAAGMSVDLSLELYAIANGVEGESGVGSLGHVLEVVTETDILEVPIVATILTAHEYDNPALPSKGLRKTSAKLISTRPPASSGIIRPRRDQKNVTV